MQDYLLTLAELSIGISGFAGVVTALRNQSETWDTIEAPRVANLLFQSIGCAVFAVLPLGLSLTSTLAEPYRLSGVLLGLYCAVGFVFIVRWRLKGVTLAQFLSHPIRLFTSLMMIVVFPVAGIMNALAEMSRSPEEVYLMLLVVFFLLACISFARLLMSPRGDR